MVVLLLPLVVFLLLCERYASRCEALRHTPLNLLYRTEYDALDSLCNYTFVLTGEPRSTARCERYEAQMLPQGKVLLYLARDTARALPQAGDTILTRTRIRRPEALGRFDYGLYLRRSGILGTAYVSRYVVRPTKDHSPSLQRRLYDRLTAAGLSGRERATTGALTLGYKEDLDPALRRLFQASGAAHVLAVSGLHTGIIYALLLALMTLGGRIRPRHENRAGRWMLSLVIIAAMWGYARLTGLTPSVVRAVLMVTIFEIGRMANRQALSLNTIAAAAVLILLVRPLDLWSVSFQLSFAATAAIVLFARAAERHLHRKEWLRTTWGKAVSWIVGTVIVSLAAQLGTLPLTMHYFGQISNYFLLTNLLVLPLATLLVPCGLLCIALGGSTLGLLVGKLTYGLAWTMNHTVGWLEALPGSTTKVSIGIGMVLIYYAIVLLFIYLIERNYRYETIHTN